MESSEILNLFFSTTFFAPLDKASLTCSRIELAAEIQSTLDGTYNSDNINGYMTAKYYQGITIEKIPEFTSEETAEARKALGDFYAKDNPKLEALNKEIAQLNSQIGSITTQSQNFNSDIVYLEQEIKSLNKVENKIATELNSLTKDI